jgi:cell division protein FtsW
MIYLATSAGYRDDRIAAWLHPNSVPSSMTYQLYQGLYGMGSGGVFGVGLGNSKMKWNWLPNADSDFIFAIIGEELGLLGALTIVVLFGLLAYTGLRISRRNVDPFVKIVAMAATIWLVGQAIINIGYVVGLLPVTGIPLPMISSGGTSLVVTMVVFGLLANFARREPQAAAALRGLGPRGIAAFLGVGVTMTGSTPRRVTKRRARREAKRAAAATARLDELTASSDDYLRRPGDPGRRPPGGSARPSSIASATASAGRTTGPAGDRNADRTTGRVPMSGSGPIRPAAKPPRQRRYRLRRVFGFPVPGEAGSRSSTGSTGSSRSSRLPRAPGSPTPASDAIRPTAGRAADGRSTTGTGADRGRPTQPTRPGARPPDDQALRGRTIRR